MKHRVFNPWKWQEKFGFQQGREVVGATRTLYLAGQTSVDADGRVLHDGDMAAQVSRALDNVETVLESAGMTLADVVRFTMYTTDVDSFMANSQALSRLRAAGCDYTSTLLGVSRLAKPELLVELEALAVT